jgi:1-acyl-sn-glycerol-3-phosphate acyltransferase
MTTMDEGAIRRRSAIRRASRVAAGLDRATRRVTRVVRTAGFPYRAPTVPNGVEVPKDPPKLGADFDTAFARKPLARSARAAITEGPLRMFVTGLAAPELFGIDRLEDLRSLEEPPAVIFTPNHHSHLDTLLMAVAVPQPWRHKLVVAAAADYFFTSRLKGTSAAIALNAFPIEREVTGRKSSDELRRLLDTGWSLVIYPEGGRSPDGWGQEFKGGAAYLSIRTGAPVVPVFIDGTGAIFGKGMKRPKPGRTKVAFGRPLVPEEDESTRRFGARIEAAVTELGDESLTDWWTARQRAVAGTSPRLTGPDHTGWRRQWALTERRRLSTAGLRRPHRRRWPDLG